MLGLVLERGGGCGGDAEVREMYVGRGWIGSAEHWCNELMMGKGSTGALRYWILMGKRSTGVLRLS